jgi:DNA-binding MarR family transcriptional regulator
VDGVRGHGAVGEGRSGDHRGAGTVVAALEESGFIERKPHPTDGRQMKIQLTAEGEAMRRSAKDARRTWLAQAIARLDEDERKVLFAAGEIIMRLVDV